MSKYICKKDVENNVSSWKRQKTGKDNSLLHSVLPGIAFHSFPRVPCVLELVNTSQCTVVILLHTAFPNSSMCLPGYVKTWEQLTLHPATFLNSLFCSGHSEILHMNFPLGNLMFWIVLDFALPFFSLHYLPPDSFSVWPFKGAYCLYINDMFSSFEETCFIP